LLPFGSGPRLCIGNDPALMEAALIVAVVVQRYRLGLMPDQTAKAQLKGTLRPRPGRLDDAAQHRYDLTVEQERAMFAFNEPERGCRLNGTGSPLSGMVLDTRLTPVGAVNRLTNRRKPVPRMPVSRALPQDIQ